MTLTITTPAGGKPLAKNFKPDDLPAPAILQDWLTLSHSPLTMSELTAAQKIVDVYGMSLSWLFSGVEIFDE